MLAVVFNHLEIPGFSGGFVGVDIFFVISGYLITRQLAEEFQRSHAIDLAAFYLRRFRRLFPAAITTCLLTLTAAFLLSSQEKLELTADSALTALVGLANIHFWLEVGYFDAEASGKPLLHMWSLGVEEQFYLFWPLLLWIGLRLLNVRALLLAVIAVGLMSFLLNALWFDTALPTLFSNHKGWLNKLENPAESAFYLMPFRVFEFSLGALVALSQGHHAWRHQPAIQGLLRWLACGVIGYAILRFDSATVFPYWNALLVASATGVVIFVGTGPSLLNRVLTHPAMVYIGAISYSLYLVHWPVIVFFRDLNGPLGAADIGWAMSIMAVLAVAMYRWVETPARHHGNPVVRVSVNRWNMPALLTLAALLATAGAAATLPSVENRIPEHRETLTNSQWLKREKKAYCQRPISGLPLSLFSCQLDRGAEKTIILWGDSHAQHLVGGFAENFPDFNIAVAYFSGCVHQSGFDGFVRQMGAKTQECLEHNHKVLEWLKKSPKVFMVLLSSAKRDETTRMSSINNQLTEQLRTAGHEAWVLGDYIRPGRWLAGCRSVPNFIITDQHLSRICLPDPTAVTKEIAYGKEMKLLTTHYIPLHDTQCPTEDNCRFIDEHQRSTFRDTHHLSPVGATFEIREAYPMLTGHIPKLLRLPKATK